MIDNLDILKSLLKLVAVASLSIVIFTHNQGTFTEFALFSIAMALWMK